MFGWLSRRQDVHRMTWAELEDLAGSLDAGERAMAEDEMAYRERLERQNEALRARRGE